MKAARKLGRRHGRARAGDRFLVEGPQAVAEAVPFVQQLLVTPELAQQRPELVASARDAGAEILEVSSDVLATVATTVSPQGIVAVAALPAPELDTVVAGASLVVALHQVRDPGNVGTAIRTADAAGADAVVLTRGSVDPRNPKAVRASAGSLFHLPVVDEVAPSALLDACRRGGLRLVATTVDATLEHTAADLGGRVALVFGSEAHGLPRAIVDSCDEQVSIPLLRTARPGYRGGAESLNLAATVAVATYEAVRQRRPTPDEAPIPRETR